MRRSLTYSPRLGELLAGERGRVTPRAGVGLNARRGDAAPDLTAQRLQLGLQRIQFGTGNADEVEWVVEREAAKSQCNQGFRCDPPCCLCRSGAWV